MLFCTKFAKKSISGLIEKRDHYHWILHIPISVHTKFQPKLTIDLFLDSDSSYNYNRISLVSVQTNYCNNNLLILDVKQLNKIIKLYYLKALWDDLGKIKMHYGMSRVKKHLPGKRSMLMFSPRFAKKKYFWSKTEEVNIAREFCIFELFDVPNFSLSWLFSFYG